MSSYGKGVPPREGNPLELTVIWGSPKGLARGAAPAGVTDGLATSQAAGDFDGDGRPDLATADGDGSIWVLHGPFTKDGAPARRTFTPADDRGGDRTLEALAAGDVDKDGITDLVGMIGWRESDIDAPNLFFWKGTRQGMAPHRTVDNHLGELVRGDALDVGDVNKDGFEDIVVGETYKGEHGPDIPPGGKITYLPGSAKGPVDAKSRFFHLETPGVPGSTRDTWAFGSAVSIGDTDGDRYEDIAIGARKTVGGKANAGTLIALRGGKNGPTVTGAREFTQDTKGVPGTAEKDDMFGSRAKFIDGNGDGRKDLAVTAIGENKNAGSVWFFTSNSTGLTAAGSSVFGGKAMGVSTAAWQRFGERYTG
ncbi:VCBS repeat-containing protein [Streptomyces amakusaensis]|uniref:VCBS repeat-containing protein n=1 Tax=Streptomyces amakusaensis TaxID=67271 RepID=A0ABW0AFU0_9ACTN